ncbi:Sulfur carrier protein FdhD, partial [Frankliniella fusca]
APADLNVSLAVHLDSHDVSLSGIVSVQDVFQVPSVPGKKTQKKQPVKKTQLICTYCLKAYVCSRSFRNHLRAHTMQEASARFPDPQKVLENSSEIGNTSLTHVSNSPSEGESGNKFKEVIGHIAGISSSTEWANFCNMMCEEILKGIENKKILLPSALATSLVGQVERIISDIDLCNSFVDALHICDIFSSQVLDQFILEFSLNFASEVLKFISKTFREDLPRRPQQAAPEELDMEDRQVIYYIAGSIMRGYLKIARRSQKSVTWQNVVSVIKNKVLVDKPTGDLVDSEWTSDVDRGGLLYVSVDCQKFFVNLTKVVFQFEKNNGSIDYMDVISAVTNSSISVLWDNIVSDSLPETVSINLMNDVVMCYCRTCGRGFAKRRLNSLRSKPMVSMPTRHLVASRKNR